MKRVALPLLLLLAAMTAHAQISLSTVVGTTETPVTTVYGFGQIALGDTKDVVFRAKNAGTSTVTVSKLAMSGSGFTFAGNPPIPYILAPGGHLDFTIHFAGGTATNYSASLQINTQIVTLLASVVSAPTLSVASPCTGPDSQNAISFGRVQQASSLICTITVTNAQTQQVTLSPITVTGSAFSTSQAAATVIPPGQSISFPVKFNAASAATFTGTLTAGIRTYTLTGTGFSAPLASPQFTFDSSTMSSGEQHTLSVKLSSASPVAASGNITLGFKPASAPIADDSAVQFVASSKRVVSFTVAQGSTSVLLNGQNNATFSTGTTAGVITFTMDAGAFGISGDATASITIAPAPALLTAAGASRVATGLKITLSGFDNTYSVGTFSFSFYDRNGAAMGSPIAANLSTNFQTFYQGQTAGSSFLLLANFPVNGDATQVGGVEVTVTNSAGSTRTQRMSFP
ncbi:MAG: choice-of-anchor D domain-containing protein [Bryobacteraceae bacterium]